MSADAPINIGQQSVNIRGVGLIDSGGAADLTQGYKVNDIENIVLSADRTASPFRSRTSPRSMSAYVPRLGKAGRDNEDDVVAAIVVMNRTLHTNDVVPRIVRGGRKDQQRRHLPPGVKIVPFYDRTSLVAVTTNTVMHNLIFGCLLVFLIQWIFLGDLRSAIIVGVNIPFALFFSIIILVLRDEDANLLSVGAVDFGIIVDSAVILVENIFRNFQGRTGGATGCCCIISPKERWGIDPTKLDATPEASRCWTDRLRLIFISAMQVDKAVFFSTAITVAAFIPLFTMQGVEGPDFQSDGADLRLMRLSGALIATFTVTPVLASLLLPDAYQRNRDDRGAGAARRLHAGAALVARPPQDSWSRLGIGFSSSLPGSWRRGSAPNSCPRSRKATSGFAPRCRRPYRSRPRCRSVTQDARDPAAPPGSHHRGLPAWPPGQRQRRRRLFQCRVLRAAQAVRRMADRA